MIKLQRNSIKKYSRSTGLWLKLSQASLRNLKMVSPFSTFRALPAQF
ncbi:hypothetical protein L289_1961 [Acinetobacter gerneri DSM 14967 = CIP 107464 = MTCC 9824]|nr:hypothetical protein L289_1961 [Acinetobacter gerneri DSM 14967 = CIP 107464 = MTCC 9824]